MKIIGLTGKMGSGKTTIIQCLKEIQHTDLVTIKFAQTLYDMQEILYGMIEDAYVRPDSFIKDRKLLQFLGTDWGRDTISATLWTDLWKQKVINFTNRDGNLYDQKESIIVCDDVRFDNEAKLIKSMGGIVIEVTSNRTSERIDTSKSNHKSELGVDRKYVDAIIDNNGTIDDLKDSLFVLNSVVTLW